mmetsp:Transcript_4665/g.14856  ORF Transcript_4665/g.14856 Transcript_4665/m.14856 type:complete len:314 (-) Transcript_4665:63-1004(-)
MGSDHRRADLRPHSGRLRRVSAPRLVRAKGGAALRARRAAGGGARPRRCGVRPRAPRRRERRPRHPLRGRHLVAAADACHGALAFWPRRREGPHRASLQPALPRGHAGPGLVQRVPLPPVGRPSLLSRDPAAVVVLLALPQALLLVLSAAGACGVVGVLLRPRPHHLLLHGHGEARPAPDRQVGGGAHPPPAPPLWRAGGAWRLVDDRRRPLCDRAAHGRGGGAGLEPRRMRVRLGCWTRPRGTAASGHTRRDHISRRPNRGGHRRRPRRAARESAKRVERERRRLVVRRQPAPMVVRTSTWRAVSMLHRRPR